MDVTKSIQLSFNDDRTESSFTAPMFTYDDFDRRLNMSLIKIARYFQWTRVESVTSPGFILSEVKFYRSNVRAFVSVCDYNISLELYQLARKCQQDRKMELVTIKTRLLNSGKSTLDFLSTITRKGNGKVLASLHYKVTAVNTDTRKRHILPESTQRLLEPHIDSSMAVGKFEPKPKSEQAFKFSEFVRPSDTDMNEHTNQASYINLCLDAATAASMSRNVFKNFKGDILQYNVKRMRMWYAKESMLGDLLTVYAWEDSDEDMCINFQIENRGKPIYHAIFWFYPITSSKL